MSTKGNILIVEDSHQVLLLITCVLNEEGFTPFQADSGKMAFTIIENSKPDLILLDIIMPEIDGFEVCKQIKANVNFSDIPIIFLTEITNTEDRLKCFELGGVDYIAKPFDKKELSARVKTHVELYRLNKSLKEANKELKSVNEEYFYLNEELSKINSQIHLSNQNLLLSTRMAEESEKRFQSTLDYMLEGAQIIGFDWRYIYINNAAEIHNKRPKEELLGNTYMQMWEGIELTEVFKLIKNCLEERIPHRMTNEFVFPDLSKGWFELSIQPVPEGVFILSIDITERKLSEIQLKEKNEEYASLNEEYLTQNEEYKELNIKLSHSNIQLKKSEQLFQTLAQNSPVGIFRTNTDGKTIYVNPKYCELTGLTYEETLGYGWQKVIFPENAEELSLNWENNLLQRKSSGSEFRIIRPDGKIVWVSGNAVPEYHNTDFVGYVGTITDITDLKNSKENIRKIKNHFQTLIEKSPAGIVLINTKGNFKYVSPTARKIFGYSETEEITGNLAEFTHPEDLPHVLSEIGKTIQDETYIPTIQYRFVDKKGKWIWVESIFRNLFSDKNIEAIVINFLDITESKNAENALKESEQNFRTLVENAPQPIYIQTDYKFSYANNAALELYGAENEAQLLDSYIIDRVHSNFKDIAEKRLKGINEKKIPGSKIEYKQLKLDYSEIFVELSAVPFTYKNKNGALVFLTDITERKLAEEKIRKSEQKFRAIFEQAAVGVALLNTKNGKFLQINNKYCNFLGYSKEELLEKTFMDITYHEDVKTNIENNQNFIDGTIREYSYEKRYIHKDGKIVWGNLTTSPLWKENENPDIYLHIAIVEDITERKLAEFELLKAKEKIEEHFNNLQVKNEEYESLNEELRQTNEELFKAKEKSEEIQKHLYEITNNIPVYIGHADRNLEILFFNNLYCDLYKTDIDFVKGKNIKEIIGLENFENIHTKIQKVLNGHIVKHENVFTNRSNQKVNLITTFIPEYEKDMDSVKGFYLLAYDITERKKHEIEIETQKNELSAIFESSHQIIFLVDEECIIHKINKHGKEFLHKNENEIFGCFCGAAFNCVNSTYGAGCGKNEICKECVIRNSIEQTYKTGEPIFNKEGVLNYSNGTTAIKLYYLVSTSLVVQKDSKKVMVTIVDITKSKENEQKIIESEKKLREAQQMAHLGFWNWNIKTGEVEWSDEVYKIFSQDPEIFKPQIDSIMKLSPWEGENTRNIELINKAIANHSPGFYEQKFLRPDNSIGYYFSTFQGNYDEKNELITIVGTVLDITEQKIAEIKLQELEIRYHRLFESAKDGILILDAETGKIVDVNPFMIDILGYSKEQFIEKTIWEIGFFKDIVANKEKFLELQKMEYVRYEELPLKTSTGQQIDIEFISIVYHANNCKVIQCNIRDITERKMAKEVLLALNNELKIQYEETETINEELIQTNEELIEAKKRAEESDRLKSAFLANMSHEIRTPMNAILGFSGLLDRPNLTDEKRKDYISRISSAGEHLLTIINDIIDISKIEANQLKISNNICSVNALLIDIYQIFLHNKYLLSKQNVKFLLNSNQFVENLKITTDVVRFNQIFINLINNAIKFTDNGFIEFGYLHKKSENESVAVFYVKDTGIGILYEKFEKLFKPFSQIDNGTLASGNGLGLSITKGLVTLLGGKIWLESEVNLGTTFYFSLPVFLNPTEITVKTKEIKPKELLNLSGFLIYVAEDDVDSYEFIVEILKETKAKIARANNGNELLSLISQQIPDLILMDINMPVKNGYDALTEIRKQNIDIPIIVQTAYAMATEKEQCLKAGFDDYISKPINEKTLLTVIQNNLKL